MKRVWYRQDREGVLAALRRGERPDWATPMACGPLDELVALHAELGIFQALDPLRVPRQRAGVADPLLLRSLATLPFLREPSLWGAAGALFREPAVLLQLGWALAQIREGDNDRHRHPDGRQPESLPCHPDTLRDELRHLGRRSKSPSSCPASRPAGDGTRAFQISGPLRRVKCAGLCPKRATSHTAEPPQGL